MGSFGVHREEHPAASGLVPTHRAPILGRVNEDLVRRMVEASELHGDFVLSSGATSTVYFDKFRFLTRPDLLEQVAAEVAQLLAPSTELLGAPEGAAMLLVAAVSLRTGLPVTVVRKHTKEYGTMARVEGEVRPGAITTLLEDVSTTGQQVRRAAKVLTEAGADVRRIVLAIDRGGADHLRTAGYDVEAVAVLRPPD
jgi:orotate phosphoribosyltransferase